MPKGSWREFNDPVQKPNQSMFNFGQTKADQQVRVQRTKGGKGGKTVTVISGLYLENSAARSLLKRLKSKCGTGGTVKGDLLELQGDQVTVVLDLLRGEGQKAEVVVSTRSITLTN